MFPVKRLWIFKKYTFDSIKARKSDLKQIFNKLGYCAAIKSVGHVLDSEKIYIPDLD